MECHKKRECGNAQIVGFDLMRIDESSVNSNIHKVMDNILIEKRGKKHYS